MYICYYDESGDDGYPEYSSPLFVLSVVYMHHLNWKENYESIHHFRQHLKEIFGIPVKWELKAKKFILNKNPYRELGLDTNQRLNLISQYCDFMSGLKLRIINVVINKNRITNATYNVLDNALKYSIQRIENDLERIDPTNRFLTITDEGRVGKMRNTSRKIQKYNYIPSKFGVPYRKEIKLMIEDPLPKNSKDSHFIQCADILAYIIYLYSMFKKEIREFHGRLPEEVDIAKVLEWMELAKSVLNLEASSKDEYGVVCYPS